MVPLPFPSISWVCFHLHFHSLAYYLRVMGLPQAYKVHISCDIRKIDNFFDIQNPYQSLRKDSDWPQLSHMPFLEQSLYPGK